jgi:hypothetical protein
VERITVLTFHQRLSSFYSLAPLLRSRIYAKAIDVTQSLRYCLKKDRNRRLLIVRFFVPGHYVDEHDRLDLCPLRMLREKYEKVVLFDDGAGGGTTRFEVLPFVDYYLKRHLYRHRRLYMRLFYGRELYTQYYHDRYGVEDDKDYRRNPENSGRVPIKDEQDLKKLRLAWNIGVGSYPLRPFRQKVGVALARVVGVQPVARLALNPLSYQPGVPRLGKVHARFSGTKRSTITGFQRKLFLNLIQEDDRFLTGVVPQRKYNAEIRSAVATLSPFGWGEMCYRDFEAILNGSALLKPDVSHLETWPDVFIPEVTYAPIDWDGKNLIAQAELYLSDERRRQELTANARDAYVTALRQCDDKVEEVLSLLLEG